MFFKSLFGFLGMAVSINTFAQTKDDSVGQWLNTEESIATTRLFANISALDTRPGIVVASPQRVNPNYYFYWVRDAALTMNTVLLLYKNATDPIMKSKYKTSLFDYANLSEENQNTPTLKGLGEPKFNVDGSAYNDPWARPQNDSPALRAITLIGFANQLLDEGDRIDYVGAKLYQAEMPPNTIIKRDLEYVAHNWQDLSYDLWEEVLGTHFYTRMVQRRAMVLGAALALRLGDVGAARFYSAQAQDILADLERHYQNWSGLLVETIDAAWDTHRPSGMDSAVILGVNHSNFENDLYSSSSDRVLGSLHQMTERFSSIYSINQRSNLPGVAIGRYPEDIYSGTQANYGNPWVLSTMAFAENLYKAADSFSRHGKIIVTPLNAALFNSAIQRTNFVQRFRSGMTLIAGDEAFDNLLQGLALEADSFVLRVKTHANSDGSLSEQMDRYSGFMTSAADLTWNYASILTAADARRKFLAKAPKFKTLQHSKQKNQKSN